MLKVLSSILCDLDPKVKVIGQKAGICDGVPSTSALVFIIKSSYFMIHVPCISAFMSEPGFSFSTCVTDLCAIAFETK